MAVTDGGSSSQGWTSTQAYGIAVLCLLVGCAAGYLLHGPVGGSSAPVSAPAPAGAAGQHPGMPPAGMAGGGQPQQTPSPEQLKSQADKQAAPLLEQLKSKPNNAQLLAQVGNLYYDAQDFPQAIGYYQKVLATDPKKTSVRMDLATAMFFNKEPDRAIAELDQTLKDDPKNGNALFNRGMMKWQAKMDLKGALADWEKLLKENPNYPEAEKVRTSIEQVKKHMNIKPGQQAEPTAK